LKGVSGGIEEKEEEGRIFLKGSGKG